jgi:16S rRNA (uracil1498-N3)-methyltransferase
MTRRRFYATPDSFNSDKTSATLNADETRHLRDVLRLTSGDEAYAFDGEGQEFRCAIAEVDRTSARLRIIEPVTAASPESALNLTLAVALLKGEKFDLVVQKATELGVTSLIPTITSRADVRIKSDDDAGRKVTRWRRIALEATKQCGRARLMRIERPVNFSDLVDQSANALRFMFAERDGSSFDSLLDTSTAKPDKLLALIGSEGGFSDEEIDQTRDAGWKIVTLGGRIMRAETAAIAITALLQHRFGDLI